MTDARLPSRWLLHPTYEALSDRAWRVHTSALMWACEQGTDGEIPARTLRLLHPDGGTTEDARELIASGLWKETDAGWLVTDWGKSQSLAADVERQRERNRLKQRAHRERVAAASQPGDNPDDVTGYVSGESLRQGEARRGEDSEERGTRARESEAPIAEEHPKTPNARRALTRIRLERHLQLTVDELVEHALRLGHGDPWAGYLEINLRTEAALVGARNPRAVLTKRLNEPAPPPSPYRLKEVIG